MINKIIDNKRKTLLENLVLASKDFDELSIATGYWDLKVSDRTRAFDR